jgi:ubiquitin-conjugating enzyme E2 O
MSRLAASASALAAFESTRSFLAASLGFAVAASEDSSAPSSSDDPATSSRKREMVMSKELGEIDWYGEVKDLKLDGMIEVMLPSGKVVEVEMERLNILNEEGDPHDHGGGSIGSEEERLEDEDGEWEDMVGDEDLLLDGEGGEGEVVEFVEERDEWEDAEEGEEGGPMDVEEETEDREEGLLKRKRADTNAETNNASPASPSTTSPAALQPLTTSSDPSLAPASSNGVSLPISSSPSSLAPQPPQPSTSLPSSSRLQPPKKDDPSWQRFLVLEDAPEDHHFYTEPIGKPNSAFFSRLQKEFKVLASSLPGPSFLNVISSSAAW